MRARGRTSWCNAWAGRRDVAVTRPALLLGLAVSAPALWGALVTGSIPFGTALHRTAVGLVAVLVAAAGLRRLLRSYTAEEQREQPADVASGQPGAPARRVTDPAGAPDPASAPATDTAPPWSRPPRRRPD